METDGISITAIVGIIGAILTVFIKLFDAINSWKKSRETSNRVKREIDHTIKEVSFINNWVEAVKNSSNGEALEARREVALGYLDGLMQTYENYSSLEKTEPAYTEPQKGDKWFYAISVFLVLGVLGLFVDDEDNWSMTYFQQNLDTDTLVGFGFILAVWVYFLINSRLFENYKKRH